MSEPGPGSAIEAPELKQCCARLYESEAARWLLGDTFHPGGFALTERVGTQLGLQAGDRVLDVASGRGAGAIYLAERFGCDVTGIDYGAANVATSNADAAARGLGDRVRFQRGDAEALPFSSGTFDALVCECAFCTFPDKARAAGEFARVLGPGGRVGITDLTRATELRDELQGLLAWIACIADARPVSEYESYLRHAGFSMTLVEPHSEALRELVQQVRSRLLATEIMHGLGKIDIPELDLDAARTMAKAAWQAIEREELGYVLITAAKS
jgi:ubiquinone/menaquinone biosynthesis C-methylase UbiE